MTNTHPLTDQELATPLGVVFAKMAEDPEFASAVADDPASALADTGVSSDSYDALVHDGALLAAMAPEVEGFKSTDMSSSDFLTNVLTNNENIAGVMVNNENITSFMTPARIRSLP